MKSLVVFLILLPFCVAGQQNHVLNPSFEDTIACPPGVNAVTSSCKYWVSPTANSPDYYHSCSNLQVSVPQNLVGWQQAFHGNAYVGFGEYITSLYREYVSTEIIPLTPGGRYTVSMYVSLADDSKYGHDGLGVYFFDSGATFINTSVVLNVTPQVTFRNYGPIYDTANWVRLENTFVADSAYDHIIIGDFYDTSQLNIQPKTSTGYAYYYVDSVTIRLTDSLQLNFYDSLLCAGDTVSVPFLAHVRYNSNNVFTVQLSDASGSFSSPVNIGSIGSDTTGIVSCVIPSNTSTGVNYKIRVISSSIADTSIPTTFDISIGNGVNKPVANNNGPVCHNDTLALTAGSSTSGVTYSWMGPANFTSTLQNPKIHNPWTIHGGDYIVTARLHGCIALDTTTSIVDSGGGPVGTVATTNAPVCANDLLSITGVANGSGNSYSWSGPNNFTSNQQNLTFGVAAANLTGDYILHATNGNCTSRDTVTVLVKPGPANFTAGYNTPLCAGKTLNLSAASTSTGVTWNWSGPNNFNSGNATPFINGVSPVHSGDYYVTADLNGCKLTDTVSVSVKPLPEKPLASNNSPFCAGITLQLNTTGNANVTYSWSGPNNYSSTAQNPVINNSTATLNGDYIISVDSNGCANKDTTIVNIKPNPAPVTLTNNTPLCAGANLQLNSTASTTGATYAWSGPNSFGANTQNTGITSASVNVTGRYKLLVDLNGCTYEDSTYATVHPIPAAPVLSYNKPLCVGETLSLTANTIGGATYIWTGANGFSATTQNPVRGNMQLTDTGVYRATVTVNNCTSATDSVSVSLNPLPFVVIQSNPTDSICSGTPVAFNAFPNNHGGTPTYNWFVNNQLTGTGNVFSTNSLNDGDIIRCEMTENTKCSSAFTDSSNDIEMTVLLWIAPAVTITANPNRPLEEDEYVTFTATAVDAGVLPDYQWKRNGTDVVGATGNVWSANTLNDNDSISVEVFSKYKCPSPASVHSNGIVVRVLTGVNDIEQGNDLKLYPNPNNGKFTLEAEMHGNGEATITIVNATGMLVYEGKASPVRHMIHKDITAELAPGVYMLNINTVDAQTTLRFVVLSK